MNVEEYLNCRESMPTCVECGAAMSGNITCRICRETNRQEYLKRGWDVSHLDRIDEINPPTGKPVQVAEIRRFMERLNASQA